MGPNERRFIVSCLNHLQVLKKELSCCTPEDQAFVGALLQNVVQLAASGAYDFGRRHDLAYARAYLAQLIRLLPREHYPILVFLALHCPLSLMERARRTYSCHPDDEWGALMEILMSSPGTR